MFLAALVAGIWVFTNPGDRHTVVLEVSAASSMAKGQDVKAGGKIIGAVDEIKAIDGGHAASIALAINDEDWPLNEGTRFALRWGGTVSAFNRFVLVTPGPRDAPELTPTSKIPAQDITVPVDFDDIVHTFDEPARAGVRDFLDAAGPALENAKPGLRKSLEVAPGAVDQAAHVLTDLTADSQALDTMLASSSNVVDAIHRSDPDFGRLLEGAATTFDAVADSENDVRVTLERLPGALQQVQDFTPAIVSTLENAGTLTRRLGPGVTQLRAIARPLAGILDTLSDVGPDAIATLRTAQQSTPRINRLLSSATSISPRLTSTLRQANTELDCVRPYTPELMGLTMTWADFLNWDDGKDKILRAQVQNFLPAALNTNPYSPGEAKTLFPQLRYGFPRPPGYLAGQPWFIEKCGAGRDSVDPYKDQEGVSFVASNLPENGR
jgi:phospholipid/cholesterol/gamma-HCH transport system substrate-binding protein